MYSFDLAARAMTEIDTGSMTRTTTTMRCRSTGDARAQRRPASVGLHRPAGAGHRRRSRRSDLLPARVVAGRQVLAFTGQRNGNSTSIWFLRRPVRAAAHDAPGSTMPEFTPDGEWIYFNSSRTGRMQIWRMRPDGSRQEQLTFDDFNNWFPTSPRTGGPSCSSRTARKSRRTTILGTAGLHPDDARDGGKRRWSPTSTAARGR